MMNVHAQSPSRTRRALHALLLVSLLLRGLIPLGFMPGWDRSTSDGGAAWLAVCPAGDLQALLANTGPHAHCDGGHRPSLSSEHAGHRLHEAHLSCPFAAAAAPGLPTARFAFGALAFIAAQVSPAPARLEVVTGPNRLPPVRGPPETRSVVTLLLS